MCEPVPGQPGKRFAIEPLERATARKPPISAGQLDEPDADGDGSQLLGAPRAAKDGEEADIAAALVMMSGWGIAGEAGVVSTPANTTIYNRADRSNEEILKSTSYGRERTRHSYWVLIEFTGEGAYVVKVLYWVKVERPSPALPLRFAVCAMYRATATRRWGGVVYYVPDMAAPSFSNAGVLLETVTRKLIRERDHPAAPATTTRLWADNLSRIFGLSPF